jgi:hypothetical protein
MARFAPFLTIKHTLLFLLAGFFLYLICNSLHTIREGATVGPAPKNFLNAGDKLLINDYIASTDKQYFIVMQSDGNLVIYKGSGPSDNSGDAVWSSRTSGSYGQTFTQMQYDGNLVIYKGTPEDPKGALWSTTTGGQASGNYVAVLGEAGILKLFQGTDTTYQDGTDYWSSEDQEYNLGQQLGNEINDYKNDQTDITSLTGKLNTMTTDYNSDQTENTALTNKVNTQSQKIISTMDTNAELNKQLKEQHAVNATLNAKLKANALEMAVFKKHIEELQNASFENKVNTELSGSVTYPKHILHQ